MGIQSVSVYRKFKLKDLQVEHGIDIRPEDFESNERNYPTSSDIGNTSNTKLEPLEEVPDGEGKTHEEKQWKL